MKQVLVLGGGVVVQDVPAPQVSPKNILVRVIHSCISVGTEMAGVKLSGLSIYKRALKQPENVKRVLEMMLSHGVKRTMDRVMGKLTSGNPTGYSAAGVVIAIGSEVDGFCIGDRVACAGAGIANHAEVIDVPVNLAVRLPDSLDTDIASTVTLGAIAMQGVRRASPTLGETIVVVGLGILGQLTAQLLRSNGCRVIGVDLDPKRIDLAIQNGMDVGIDPTLENYVERVHRLTDGFGADAVIVTAAANSDTIISEAMQACRRKGRVVLVGDVGLDLNRADLFKKELDFLISTSYGPGRYDPYYEEGGQDYPLPYVRWTENRNMESYLQLLAKGEIKLANLYRLPYPIDRAPEAYEALKGEGEKPLLVLLEYPESQTAMQRKVVLSNKSTSKPCKIRIGLAGAGGFAQGMHLPNILKLNDKLELHAVMSRTGSNARAVATQNSAKYATTNYAELLEDPDVDLVMIATRHDLHGQMVLDALRAGKHVFVEKPLAIKSEELDAIEDFFANCQTAPVLMTGFNRRFSQPIVKAKHLLRERAGPLMISYRMNAGYLPKEHWVHGEEGGGRNIGEACHIYDLFGYLTGAKAHKVEAAAIREYSKQWKRNDNFSATVTFDDGSVCNLIYTALGHTGFPKERMDIFGEGKVINLDNYISLTVAGAKNADWKSTVPDKGLLDELKSLADCIINQQPWPISLDEQLSAMRISYQVEEAISTSNNA